MKKAFITGITGQDGAYLAELLLRKGYKVIGGERRNASGSLWRLKKLGIEKRVHITNFELSELTNIDRAIKKYLPDEFYNLASQSFVQDSFELPIMTTDITGLGVGRILEVLRNTKKKIKFYQASSSEMFGKATETPQKETTPFYPRSPYGAAKLFGHWLTINYRESYNMFACSGILFNHESPLRGEKFVTKKITTALARIKLGKQDCLRLGNIDSKRDWGFAGDYVEAIYKILQQKKPGDFVISTGKTHTVRKFVETSAKLLGMKIQWRGHKLNERGIDKKTGKTIIKIDRRFFRPAEVDVLHGDYSRARKILKWEPKTSFNELVEMMTISDYNEQKKISNNLNNS